MSKIVSLLCAAVVMIGVVSLDPAVAQQAQTAGIVTFDLFTGDSVDLDPDGATTLQSSSPAPALQLRCGALIAVPLSLRPPSPV